MDMHKQVYDELLSEVYKLRDQVYESQRKDSVENVADVLTV